ncbi:outer membrane protein assembly factor BamB [Actinomadura rupiterrae]|nr:outer membrane protein assembly factor BamB [Actinomadura rupiterrae]
MYTATGSGEITALDAATGAPLWTAETGERISHDLVDEPDDGYDEGDRAVLKADDTLYIRTNAGIIALR